MDIKPPRAGRRPAPWTRLEDGSAAGWAGVIAGAVYLSAQMTMVTVVRQDSPWVPLQRISALLLGPDVFPPPPQISLSIAGFALLIHFTLSFMYGRLIARVVRRVRPALGWMAGAGCGLAIYLVDFHVIAPLLFRWFEDSQGAVTLFDHLLFRALSLALTFIALSGSIRTGLRPAGRRVSDVGRDGRHHTALPTHDPARLRFRDAARAGHRPRSPQPRFTPGRQMTGLMLALAGSDRAQVRVSWNTKMARLVLSRPDGHRLALGLALERDLDGIPPRGKIREQERALGLGMQDRIPWRLADVDRRASCVDVMAAAAFSGIDLNRKRVVPAMLQERL